MQLLFNANGQDQAPDAVPAWVQNSVFYQIFPDRFAKSHHLPKPFHLEPWDTPATVFGFKGGDLLGVAERLEEVQELGVNAIYLNPVFTSTANHRYHTFDYFSIDPVLGRDAAFRTLLDRAHALGLRVIIDGVFNHASRGFFQFNHILENGAASPYRDWFHVNPELIAPGQGVNAYHPSGAANEEEALRLYGYRCWANLPALPKFNTHNPEVRKFLFAVARHWIEFGVDGWRLDVPNEIDDDDFWREFRRVVKTANSEAYIVGEIWDDATRWLKGDQFDAVMNYRLGTTIIELALETKPDHSVTTRSNYDRLKPISIQEGMQRIAAALASYPAANTLAQLNVLTSHDTPRLYSLFGENEKSLRIAFTLLFTMPGAPCLYYGDEIGMRGGQDPGCRSAYPEDARGVNPGLRAFVAQCAALRGRHAALRHGQLGLLEQQHDWLAYCRWLEGEALVVLMNRSHEDKFVDVALPEAVGPREKNWRVLLGDNPEARYTTAERRLQSVYLPARTVVVLG